MLTWPAVTTTGILKSKSACFCRYRNWSLNDGDLANLFSDNEKVLNIVIAGRECILGVDILGLWPLDRMFGKEGIRIQLRVAAQDFGIFCNTAGSLRDGMPIQRKPMTDCQNRETRTKKSTKSKQTPLPDELPRPCAFWKSGAAPTTHCSRLQGFFQVNGEWSTGERILIVSFTSWRTRYTWPAISSRFSTLNFIMAFFKAFTKSTTPSQNRRTAEVTICVILERLLDRPRQLPHFVGLGILWRSHEKTWWKVSLMEFEQLHRRQHSLANAGHRTGSLRLLQYVWKRYSFMSTPVASASQVQSMIHITPVRSPVKFHVAFAVMVGQEGSHYQPQEEAQDPKVAAVHVARRGRTHSHNWNFAADTL